MHPYSILMFAFSVALLIYSGILSKGIYQAIPKYQFVKMKNPQEYAKQLAPVIAICAAAPLASGVMALIVDPDTTFIPALAVLVVGFVVCIVLGVKLFKKRNPDNNE